MSDLIDTLSAATAGAATVVAVSREPSPQLSVTSSQGKQRLLGSQSGVLFN